MAREVVSFSDQDYVEPRPIPCIDLLLCHGGSLLGEVRNLLVNLAYQVFPLLVIRTRFVPAVGERLRLEVVAARRALEEPRRS